MINEIKRVWKQYSTLIIIFFLLEIIFCRFAADFIPINIRTYLGIQMTIPVILIFLFAFTKESITNFEHALPISKIKLFFNKFIPAILIVMLINLILYWAHNSNRNLFFLIKFTFTSGYVLFLFFYFISISTFKYTYLILFILIDIYGNLFPLKIINPLTQEMVNSFRFRNPFIFLICISIPLIFYFFSYQKKLYYKFKVIIITFLTYIILIQGSMFLEIYSHKGEPFQVVGYDRYISLFKSEPSRFLSLHPQYETICYDIETKKTKRKIMLGFKTYIWDKDRMIITESKNTTINLQKFKTNEKLNILNIEYNIHPDALLEDPAFIFKQICGPTDSYYICQDNRVLKVNLKTLTVETVLDNIKYLSKNIRNKAIIIQHDEKYYAVSSIFGIKELADPKADFIFGKDYFFIIDENKMYDEAGNIIYSSNYILSSINFGRAFYENGKRKTYFNKQFVEIPDDSKFNNDKIYYHNGNEITFSYLDGKIIVKQKFDRIDFYNGYLIYQYKDNYYLFLYGRNPVKVYKLINDTWEFYDSFQ
ncbi:hypothetical protein KAU33_12725 [Candidatus Dependentiae bacterium]|nr:hypothetical protein [Candidatus Dependentiae bacterium]